MGFRFRKSIRIFPGVRVNLSKTGIGASIGFKGFRLTKRADGKTQKTFSLPGTGISYVDVEGANSNKNEVSSKSKRRSTTSKCPTCQKPYRIGVDQFCSRCGAKL